MTVLNAQLTKMVEEWPDGSLASALSYLRNVLISIAIFGIAANFLFFYGVRDFETPDSSSYVVPAGNLAKGQGFTNTNGYPELTRTPGYPLLIAPFLWIGLDLKYLIILQHLLQVLISLAAAIMAYMVSGSRRQAMITGILLCLDLPSLNSANTIMTETFFTANLMVIIWLLWKAARKTQSHRWQILLAGLVSGWSVLIRPITMYFFLPVIAYWLLIGKNFRRGTVLSFVLSFACLPLAWAARNYAQTGYFTVTSISGWDMLGYRAAGALAVNDPGDFSANLEKRQDQLLHQACASTLELSGEVCMPLTIPQELIPRKSKAYMKIGTRVVLQHPLAYAKLAARGAATMMLGGDAHLIMQITGLGHRSAKGLILIYTVPAFCLAIAGLYSFWNKNRLFFYLAFLVFAYFVVISAGAETYSRMRVPIMPLYCVVIAAGMDLIIRRFFHGGIPAKFPGNVAIGHQRDQQ